MRSLSVGSIVWIVTLSVSVPFAQASEPWQSQGPAGTFFHSLAQAPDGSILAGTVSGLFRFDDPNLGWQPIPLDQPGVGLVFVSSDGVMFSQSYSSGCISAFRHFVSVDNGETWFDDDGLPNWTPIVAIAETPDGTLWAGGHEDILYRRTPGASSWTQHPPITPMGAVFDLAATTDGSLLVLALDSETDESLVFLSDDDGGSWSIPLRTAPHLSELAVGPLGSAVVGGWEGTPVNLTFFSSTNSGRTWSERPCTTDTCSDLISIDGLVILDDRRVAVTGRATNRVSSRLIVSDLFMEQWNPAADFSESPRALLTDRTGALWVAGLGFAWRSTDNAATFEPVSTGVVGTSVTSLAESGGRILATVGSYAMGGWAGFWTVPGTAGIHLSADNGVTWHATAVWQANQLTESLLNGVLAATDIGVLRSVDHGSSWQTIPITENVPVRAVAEDPLGTLCVISGLHLSCSKGDEDGWHGEHDLVQTDNALTVTPDGVFLVEILGNVHRSTDGGHTWDPTPLAEDIVQFTVSPDGVVYAPVNNSDCIAVSEDSGITWDVNRTPVHNPLSVAFHPVEGVLVGFDSLVFSSDDRFETWNRIDLRASSLLVNGDRLVAGSDRDGVWLADLPPSVRYPSSRTGR